MGIANIINTSTSSGGGGGEIIRELINSSDGAGVFFSNTGYIHLANNAAVEFGTSDFSIEFVMNQTGEVGSSGGSIYQSATTVNNKFSIENHVSSNVVKLIFFNAVGAAAQYDLPYNMAADYNEPTHYVVSCDRSGNAVLYRNGTEVASVSIAASASTNLGDGVTSTAMIGNSGSGYTFLGGLYRFRTWNKALSHDEVDTCFQRADVPFIDQYGSETDLVNANSSGSGTAWTGATGTTAPTGWSPAGSSRTYTIDASTGDPAPSLKINAGSANVGIKWGGTATLGKKHRVTFSYKCGDAATTMAYRLNDADSFVNLANSTSWATTTVEWTGDGVTGGFMLRVNESGKFGHVDTVSIRAIGCVSDYDLAFANPTQSAMCQDRAGNSDGTMGGTIQQTQKIVQVNAVAARIGTSAATPADGDLLVGNDLAVGGSAIGDLTVYKNATPTKILLQNSTSTNAASKGLELYLSGNNAGIHNWQNGSMNFATNNVNRLTISSAGNVGLSRTPSANQAVAYGPSLQVGQSAALIGAAGGNNLFLSSNALFDNSNWKLTNAGQAGQMFINTDGSFTFRQERTSGSANDNISWDDALTISSAGNVTQAGGEFILEDGSGATVGKISTIGTNNLTISGTQANHCGVSFATNAILPCTQSTVNDNTVDLGANGNAFKDLWIDGEAKIGGLATFANGIAFQSATGGTGTGTGYTLDKYEVGTWTGSLTAATPPTSVPTATGNYTRIGNLVHFQIKFAAANTSGASGVMEVTGLPFTVANGNNSDYSPINAIFYGLAYSNSEAIVYRNESKIRFYNQVDGAAWSNYNITAGTDKYLWLSGTYQV